MSSYARYCDRQASECARRARLASSPDIKAYHQRLVLQWLKLTEKARAGGGFCCTKSNNAAGSDAIISSSSAPKQIGLR
jgi:hypothetical protein